jgi:cytochrome c biogenesis protein CcmG/thiol:disulfide interchange protein DsbE
MTTDSDRPDDVQPTAHAVVSPTSSRRWRQAPTDGSTKALIGVLLAGIAGMVIFLFVHVSKDGRIHPGPIAAHAECTRGQPDCLPEVNYTDTAGVAYKRDQLAGKVVLVNFWATWCHPCQSEIPALSKVYDKYKAKGVVFLGVMTDNVDSQRLLNFQSDYEMSYPVVRANSDLMVSFNYPDALPTTFVYDKGGKQVFSHVGPVREADLDSLLGQLIAQN